eukprot:TRINITY_DN65576_c0_g1_i1.p1 TRINITY_DN65576_c0_g1~~TRINITY_DN65576_c0_g1_i1.p1  ORF type:complete len:790 (+),score=336.26 TRINITY_DN65576_c0_g1_i1:94-2370(+)
MAGIAAFLSVFVPTIIVFTVLMIVFSFMRRRHPRFYQPRRLLYRVDDGLVPPPDLGDGLFDWLRVLKLTDDELVATAGLDAYVFLKFLRTASVLFAVLGFFTAACCIPVYATADTGSSAANHTHDNSTPADDDDSSGSEVGLKDIEHLTLSNLGNEATALWAPVMLTWFVTCVVWYMLWDAYATVTRTCKFNQYLKGVKSYSIILFAVPKQYRSDKAVREYFERFFPGEVRCCTVALKADALEELVAEYKANQKALRHAEVELEETGERPMHVLLTAPQGGKVDSINHYQSEIERLAGEIAKLREKAPEAAEVALVSFTSPICAAKASQLWYAQVGWVAEEAPEPRDVYWPNLMVTAKEKSSRETVVAAATAALVFFWAIPVAAISALTTLDNLEKWAPPVKSVVEVSEALKTFLVGFLPTLALIVFMALLPSILLFFSKLEGLYSWSLLERAVLKKMYYFQVVNVFLVTALSGAVLDSIGDIVDSPTSTFKILGKSIPKVSTFFCSYVVMQSLGGFPMELLRLVPLLLNGIWGMRGALTEQERAECDDPGTGSGYGLWFSGPLLVFTIVLIYSVIAPLILPFGCLYFFIAYLCHSYNIVYVWRPKYQSNGRLWAVAFSRMVAGLTIMQGTMIGVMSLKYAKIQGPFLVPLPVLTYFFWRECHTLYRRAASETPLEALLRPDGAAQEDLGFLDQAYVRTCLRPELDDKPDDKRFLPAPERVPRSPVSVQGSEPFDGDAPDALDPKKVHQFSEDVEEAE